MLPAINRLKKKKDFEVVFAKGKRIATNLFWCKALKNGLTHSRVGFVVSKKVSPKAVVRNKVRRRLQNSVENSVKDLRHPYDIIIVALPSITQAEFSEIKEVVAKVFTKFV